MKTLLSVGLSLFVLGLPLVARADGSVVTGTVKYGGPARAAGKYPVTQDEPVCGKSKPDETLLLDGAGGVRNVVVSLVGVAGAPKPPPGTAHLDQKGCMFLPHVQAVPSASTLLVTSNDAVLHNIHGYRGENTLFNLAMPTPGLQVKRKLGGAGLSFFRCDAGHTWMSSYVWTFDHPYFAVTDVAGKFSIANVPPGSYTLHAWHEGWKRKDGNPTSIITVPVVVEQPITVEAGKAVEVALQIK